MRKVKHEETLMALAAVATLAVAAWQRPRRLKRAAAGLLLASPPE